MNELRIRFSEDRRAYLPGETIEGAAGWQRERAPKMAEIRLLWFTRGKGTVDSQIVDAVQFNNLKAAGVRPFRFELPLAPYSFSGRLISLIWVVELVASRPKDVARLEFVLGPQGREVVLPHVPAPAVDGSAIRVVPT